MKIEINLRANSDYNPWSNWWSINADWVGPGHRELLFPLLNPIRGETNQFNSSIIMEWDEGLTLTMAGCPPNWYPVHVSLCFNVTPWFYGLLSGLVVLDLLVLSALSVGILSSLWTGYCCMLCCAEMTSLLKEGRDSWLATSCLNFFVISHNRSRDLTKNSWLELSYFLRDWSGIELNASPFHILSQSKCTSDKVNQGIEITRVELRDKLSMVHIYQINC